MAHELALRLGQGAQHAPLGGHEVEGPAALRRLRLREDEHEVAEGYGRDGVGAPAHLVVRVDADELLDDALGAVVLLVGEALAHVSADGPAGHCKHDQDQQQGEDSRISSGMATSELLGVEQRVHEVYEATDTEDGSDKNLSHAE